MSATLQVLAFLSGLLIITAYGVALSGRRHLATWILVLSFGVATLWAGLNIPWSQHNPSPLSAQSWLLLTTTAATAGVYYLYLGMQGRGLGGGQQK